MCVADVQIGKRLSAARSAVGLTQRDLEQYTGISQSTIHRTEAGERRASTLELSTLADACGVLIADLQGTNTLSEKVRYAGRTTEDGCKALSDYMIYAFGVARRLDELGVPEVA